MFEFDLIARKKKDYSFVRKSERLFLKIRFVGKWILMMTKKGDIFYLSTCEKHE